MEAFARKIVGVLTGRLHSKLIDKEDVTEALVELNSFLAPEGFRVGTVNSRIIVYSMNPNKSLPSVLSYAAHVIAIFDHKRQGWALIKSTFRDDGGLYVSYGARYSSEELERYIREASQ